MINKKLKILEVTSFSAGSCGIWARVKKEVELLAKKGYDLTIFSSDIYRGTGKIEYAPKFEQFGEIKIYRFRTKGRIGENSFFWNYTKEALRLKPNIIICHAYRQYYSTIALKIAKKLRIPCILVTHAPFIDKKIRGWRLNAVAWVYDNLIGKKILNNYSKIFAISKWEIPYLLNLGVKKEKIIYVPNGVPDEFFKFKILKKRLKKQKQILFLGRIAPIKDIETLIKAFIICLKENNNIFLNLVGPIEEDYKENINALIDKFRLKNKIKFYGPVFNLKKKLKIIDNSDVFVLPSKREGMPQALVEAMARGKVVVSSNIQAGKEIVKNNETGYLFDVGNEKQLSEKILEALKNNKKNEKIRKQARKFVEQFAWGRLINEIENIIKNEVKNN